MKTKLLCVLMGLLMGYFSSADAQSAVSVGNLVNAVSDLVSGKAYLIKYTSMTGTPYIYDAGTSLPLQAPSAQNSPTTACVFYFLSDGNGAWKLKNDYTGNYWPAATGNARLYPTTEANAGSWAVSISSGTATMTCTNGSTTYGLDRLTPDVVSWSSRKTVQIYEVDESVDLLTPTASEVYTINNTNSYRGPLTYDPAQSDYYVWTSGKNGATAFDATSANCQWVFYPTATEGQYYLYNVGADRFAIPDGMTNGATCHWVFSRNAVAVMLLPVGDGTYKIQAANAPVSGTNNAYVSVSIGQTYPIINYNDAGSQFTITKVSGANANAAVTAAVGKLVGSQTALTAAPSSSGWYAVKIRTAGTASYVGRYVKPAATEYTYTNGATYSLTFAGEVDVQPAIDDATYYTYIDATNKYWQMPNGRYLVPDGNGKFPTSSADPTALTMAYNSGNTFRTSAGMYAVPYNSGTNYFIGESSTSKTYYVYPINLATAGLTAWQMLCTAAPETQEITCSRSDVTGLTSVYKNGYFFLPAGVTPDVSDFELEGATGATINTSAHTVTFQYDPNLAMVEGSISVEQGWQTAGRDGEVMLLRVTASPFKAATGVTMNVTLKDGAESSISSLTLYEASNSSPEILSTGTGSPTKTAVGTTAVSGSTVTLSLGNLTKGTHYYWIGATVKNSATLGAVLDAAVSGITYTCNSTQTTLDLTAVGDPADRGAMVFNTRSYPFLPRDNGSRVYRIPAMVVANDGSIVVAADKRYESYTDIGGGHVIDIVVRRSTDGGKTWSAPVTIAKGDNSNDATCGYGDPSLVKGKDGKLYCLYAAGNLGYGKGLKRICMSTSTDNGITWSSSTSTPPVDLYETGAIKNAAPGVGNAGGYGLYDYFVTSGRGLYTSDGILMYLIPAQTLTADNYQSLPSSWNVAADDYLFYSTDDGATWRFSQTPMIVGGDEAKVIEMNDGSLLGSIRKATARRFNTATYTAVGDGTLSFEFGTQWDNSQLYQTSQNNQDILYYQRAPKSGKTDVIFHSMTTGNHANLVLYYSTDQGRNWTEFLNIQTKGTRYVTLDRGGSEENPGSLYLLFEDQSLNATGGYTDYNHYPLNFLEITRDQLVSLIPALDEEAKEVETKDVKIVYGTAGETTYGTTSGNTWTSNNASGQAGLTLTKSDGSFNKFTSWQGYYNLAYAPGAANTPSTLTLTAPEGYVITGYSFLAAKAYSASHTYTIVTSDGQTITPAFNNNAGTAGYTEVSVTGLRTASEVISITSTDASKYLAIANFTVQLESIQMGDVDKNGKVDVDDVTMLARVLLGLASAEEYDANAADVDGENGITLADLTALVNIIRGPVLTRISSNVGLSWDE